MKRVRLTTATVLALAAAMAAVALVAPALGTQVEVGTAPGDVIGYGPTTGVSGTSGTSGTTGTTGATGLTGITGVTNTSPVPQCPGSPCLAITQTTGFQVKVGSDRSIDVIPRNGTIVAWTVTLSSPTTTAPAGQTAQTTYFDNNEGGPAEAGIAILKPSKHLEYTLVGQSPPVALQPYFGETVEFPLATTIPVTKGEILALTVPTWAPILALTDTAGTSYGKFTSWRSSRQKGGCTTTSAQAAQRSLRSTVQYYCLYQKVRLAYSALEVATP